LRYSQGILVSCEIPWDERDSLQENEFRKEIRHILRLGFTHLYIFGTAGEGYAVDSATFRRIVQIFREETHSKNVFPQVGIIGLSTANVLERLEIAHSIGFRMFQISLPCWGRLNDKELLRYFADVCGPFKDSRFLHYNLQRAKRVLTARDYARLADAIPNLVATKNTGTTISSTIELMRAAPDLQHFLSEAMFPIGCLQGECSMLSSYGLMLPSKTRELFEYGRTAQTEKLFLLHRDYLRVVEDVLRPLHEGLIDGAYDKVLARLGGIDMPLRLLSPYESFPEETYQQCRAIFEEKYAEWMH